jgi:short-subunit dehydrogenase
LEQNLDDLLLTTEVNCNATVILTHTFAKRMAAQGRGGIILMASGTALQGSPTFAHYAATKAHNLVFGEALWYELRAHGVDVLSFIPGPTNTPALRSQNPRLKEGVSVGPIQLPGPTAEAALRALGKGPCAARDANFRRRLANRRQAIEEMGERFLKPNPAAR